MKSEIIVYIVPSWSLSYLINADMSGYTDEEEKAIVDFERECISEAEKQGATSWHFATDDENDEHFAPCNDVTGWEGGQVEQINFVMMFPDTDNGES